MTGLKRSATKLQQDLCNYCRRRWKAHTECWKQSGTERSTKKVKWKRNVTSIAYWLSVMTNPGRTHRTRHHHKPPIASAQSALWQRQLLELHQQRVKCARNTACQLLPWSDRRPRSEAAAAARDHYRCGFASAGDFYRQASKAGCLRRG